MNNTHQELIAEKVAEFNKIFNNENVWQGEDDWTKNVPIGNLEQWLTQTLQDTIDTVLEGEREEIGAMIEEADYARKVGERTGEPIAVWEVQDVIRQIKALIPTQTK
jgi:hypothetical protein